MDFYAHTSNESGHWQKLADHLKNVSSMASKFASKFGAEDLAYWAGLWHDLGKRQSYF